MKKVRSNASWTKLSAEQRETLDKWLFDEKLGYAVAWPRAQKELGFTGSMTSLHRYFVRRDNERTMREFRDLRQEMLAVSAAPGDAASAYTAAMKLLGHFLFKQVKHAPDKVNEWAPVADLMVRNNYNELVREAKAREHQMRQEAMEFAKEKYEMDVMERALQALPELQQLVEAKKDPNLKRYAENAHYNQLRQKMFGMGIKVHPESAAEEAEMLAAKHERERQEGQKPNLEEKVVKESQPPVPSSPYYQPYLEAKARRAARNAAICGEAQEPPKENDEPTTNDPG